jgi:hypothetical protein
MIERGLEASVRMNTVVTSSLSAYAQKMCRLCGDRATGWEPRRLSLIAIRAKG